MSYTKGEGHVVEAILYDATGTAITTGTATTKISKDSGAFAATTNSMTHVSEGLWTVTLTDTEANCDRYRVKVSHDDLLADVFVTDQAAEASGLATSEQVLNGFLSMNVETDDIKVALAGITGAVGGEGAFTGTLTVDDGEGTGIEGAVVHAQRGGVLKASGTTDANGQITNWVFGGYTYDLAVRVAGYQPKTDTITVSADAWTKTISLTALSITAPGDASLCTIQFRVKLSATAVSGAVCKARLLGTNQASDGTILSTEELSDTTDSQGVAELQLVQQGSIVKGDGRYKIWTEIAGKTVASVETSIPNQSVILFEDLLGA